MKSPWFLASTYVVYMQLTREELFGSNEWFEARNMHFLSNVFQLHPVNGTPIFEKISQKSLLQTRMRDV